MSLWRQHKEEGWKQRRGLYTPREAKLGQKKNIKCLFSHAVFFIITYLASLARLHYGNEVMLLWLTITHWLWILLLKVWLLLDGGFKWIVLRSDKELIARNKSPEQWRKATHMEWLGDTGYYGEGMVSLTARTAYNFISSCFAGCWQWCVTLALEEEGKHESHFRSHLHSVSGAAWNNHVSLRAYMHISHLQGASMSCISAVFQSGKF